MFEYHYKLIDNFVGEIRSKQSLGRPQVVKEVERKHGPGMVKSVDGIDVFDAGQNHSQSAYEIMSASEIQRSWDRAFASVRCF